MRATLSLIVLSALLCLASAENATGGAAAGGEEPGCPFTLSVPWTFQNETVIDLSEKVEVEGDNPLKVTTLCTCPAQEEIPTVCTCEGPASDDCDAYAQIVSAFYIFAEKFMGIFIHMDEMKLKYHIENVLFFGILGMLLFWAGLILVLYSEIKAVIITRERDEREEYVAKKELTPNESCKDLIDKENDELKLRPYMTMFGAVVFWVGTLLQFIPLCGIISLIFPGLEVFQGMCFVFVVVGTLVLSVSTFFFVIGLCWSCTRGWAALVLLSLGLLGDVMILGGPISIVIWFVLSGAVLFVYFSWAPNWYKEQVAEKPVFIQELGPADAKQFFEVGFKPDEWQNAAVGSANLMVKDTKDTVTSLPGGKTIVEAGEKAADAAQKGIDATVDLSKQAASTVTSAIPGQGGEESGKV